MVSAYIFAKIETGKNQEVAEYLRKITEIREASFTYGLYDLIIEVDFETLEMLDDFIFRKIRTTPGIVDTMTILLSQKIV